MSKRLRRWLILLGCLAAFIILALIPGQAKQHFDVAKELREHDPQRRVAIQIADDMTADGDPQLLLRIVERELEALVRLERLAVLADHLDRPITSTSSCTEEATICCGVWRRPV